jgi:hypothetical protein
LLKNKECRRDSFIQEDTWSFQHRFLKHVLDQSGAKITDIQGLLMGPAPEVKEEDRKILREPFDRQVAALTLLPLAPPGAGLVPTAAMGGLPAMVWNPKLAKMEWASQLFFGPFDVDDSDGVPLISMFVRYRQFDRLYPGAKKNMPSGPPGGPPVLKKGKENPQQGAKAQ